MTLPSLHVDCRIPLHRPDVYLGPPGLLCVTSTLDPIRNFSEAGVPESVTILETISSFLV